MTDPPLSFAVLIPALNEELSLPGVIEVARKGGASRVVVADNGSTDRTAEVAAQAGAEVIREDERGYGAACLAGIRHLRHSGSPGVLVFMDADAFADPNALGELIRPILEGRAHLVMGARQSEPSATENPVPFHARWGNRLVLSFARLLHGVRAQDLGPFRAMEWEALELLEMDDRSWGWTLQMQLRAHHAGLTVEEIPLPHRKREAGRSTITGSLVGSLRAGGKMFYTLGRELLWRGRMRQAGRTRRLDESGKLDERGKGPGNQGGESTLRA